MPAYVLPSQSAAVAAEEAQALASRDDLESALAPVEPDPDRDDRIAVQFPGVAAELMPGQGSVVASSRVGDRHRAEDRNARMPPVVAPADLAKQRPADGLPHQRVHLDAAHSPAEPGGDVLAGRILLMLIMQPGIARLLPQDLIDPPLERLERPVFQHPPQPEIPELLVFSPLPIAELR